MGILLYSIRATNSSDHSELERLVIAGAINPDLQQALVRSPSTAIESTLAQPFRLNADERSFLQTLRPGNYADFVGEVLHWLASRSLVVTDRHEIPAPRHALPVTPTISVSLTCPGEPTPLNPDIYRVQMGPEVSYVLLLLKSTDYPKRPGPWL